MLHTRRQGGVNSRLEIEFSVSLDLNLFLSADEVLKGR